MRRALAWVFAALFVSAGSLAQEAKSLVSRGTRYIQPGMTP
jgi:hypothetical protein